jgi:1-acyl-sn-glycerol-3-phosphate acyltransferase
VSAIAASPPQPIGLIGGLRIIVRVLAMALWLLICVPLFYLAHVRRRPNPWPRRFLAGIGWISGVKLTVAGEKPQGRAFLLANHVSWIDIPALAAACGTAFIAQDGLAQTPLLRHLCAMNDTVFVARHDRTTVRSQVAAVRHALRDMGALTIFPEGTTSNGTDLLPFKSSLLSALEPIPDPITIVPVLLDYGPESPAIAWIGVEHGLANFLRILTRARPMPITVRFLPPLTGTQAAGRKAIASHARAAIHAALLPG